MLSKALISTVYNLWPSTVEEDRRRNREPRTGNKSITYCVNVSRSTSVSRRHSSSSWLRFRNLKLSARACSNFHKIRFMTFNIISNILFYMHWRNIDFHLKHEPVLQIIFRLNQSFTDYQTDYPVHRLPVNCHSSNLNGSSEHMIC